MADLNELREKIDGIDAQILALFEERMRVAGDVAAYKRERDLPVMDRARERAKLADVAAKAGDGLAEQASVLFSLLMEASRAAQHKILGTTTDIAAEIERARENSPEVFPPRALVACQGVEGSYSQQAADKIFKHPSISYFNSFEAVFRAVDEGFCEYGVLPVENSTAGTVNQVYDLMMSHNFHIVRSTRLKVDHSLLAKPGASLSQIRDIYTHQQAIDQCAHFLADLDGVSVHACENTAIAAQMVAQSERDDIAAISSRSCAELYGLATLASDVQDQGSNFTRFACISKKLEIFPGSDRTSLMMILDHEPGALYKALARFYALDINLVKLESRPIPGRDFEFMFYFDIECPVASPEFAQLVSTLDDACDEWRYLGSYNEVV